MKLTFPDKGYRLSITTHSSSKVLEDATNRLDKWWSASRLDLWATRMRISCFCVLEVMYYLNLWRYAEPSRQLGMNFGRKSRPKVTWGLFVVWKMCYSSLEPKPDGRLNDSRQSTALNEKVDTRRTYVCFVLISNWHCNEIAPIVVSGGNKIVSARWASGAKMNQNQRKEKIRVKKEREKRTKT